MTPSRPATLAVLVAGIAAVTWAALQYAYAQLPPLPWTAIPTLLLLAMGEFYTALNVRSRIQRRNSGGRPFEPITISRFAALAKASTHAAAVLAGVFAGFAIALASSLDRDTTPRADFLVSTGSFVAAVGLGATAMFLEHSCRVPKDEDEQDGETGTPRD